MKLKLMLPFIMVAALTLIVFTRCGSDSTKTTYASTSTKGDFAQWTVDGNNLSATWQITDGTGAITKTLTINATCGAADATYVYKTCTVSSASCANGTATCSASDAPSAGDTFYTFEIPGTAFMVKAAGGGSNELHVGYVLDTSCGGVAGDYAFLHLGNRQSDLFGIYRTNADFSAIQHADFDIRSATCTTGAGTISSGGCAANDNVVTYSTGSTGTGVETVTGASCSGGVRTMTMNSSTIRVMQSQSGIFLMDLPAGQGGILAFKTDTAASLADFASKELAGIAFPDNGSEQLMHATTGAVSGSGVPITAIAFKDGGTPGMTSPVITANTNTTSTAQNPAYPNFTTAPAAGSHAYAGNTLQSTYANAAAIPGSFRIDGTFGDRGRVLLMATKVNGKVLAFGEVYNWRDPSDTGFSSLPNGERYYNSGAFILFEK